MELSLVYILIAIGILMLLAELFIPSGGLLFLVGIGALLGGVVLAFQYDTSVGWVTLIGTLIGAPILVGTLFHYWPKTRFGRQLFLTAADDATVATMPTIMELEQFRGKIGKATSALRPAGVVDFEGRRIDVITEGLMVDPGQWVRCIDVRAGTVVVRPIDKPDLGKLEDTDFAM